MYSQTTGKLMDSQNTGRFMCSQATDRNREIEEKGVRGGLFR
jgi:hypothetical protein